VFFLFPIGLLTTGNTSVIILLITGITSLVIKEGAINE